MEHKTSFWELITAYSIEIPKIQRDYVQGRDDEKTKTVAKQFLADIKTALENNTELSLDFIYGKIEDEIFIPIDGQQRLTTLFLLHWYYAVKEDKLTDENKAILSKFTYETRLTSIDFCKNLVAHGDEYVACQGSIKEVIEDSTWYFASWKYDPTIVSMLNMLDIISDTFYDTQTPVFEKLTGTASQPAPIIFYFLPMEDFKLTDALYIKMNARGKQLTDFENFKTIFSDYLDDIEDKAGLDNRWLDIFWKQEKEDAEKNNRKIITDNVDKRYFAFFKHTASNFYAEFCSEPESDAAKKKLVNYPLFLEYNEIYKNRVYVQEIMHILNSLVAYKDDKKIFESFLSDNLTYWDRVRFYTLSRYFIWEQSYNSSDKTTDTTDKKIRYKRWMRVTLNLINNTRIEGPEDYKRAIDAIKNISGHIADIYEYISGADMQISFFSQLQQKEERLKAQLILKDVQWEEILIDAEKCPYFDGQIGFMLEYAKDQQKCYDKDTFRHYADILKTLFGSSFQEKHDFLFQRALLTKGNYLIENGWNYSFCHFELGLRAKTDNWRKVFNSNKKTRFLKALLDDIKNDDVLNNLKAVIEQSKVADWRSIIIKKPDHIKYCQHRQIYTDDWKKIYLVSKTRMNSYHAELFSYNIYSEIFENKKCPPFSSVWYYYASSSWEEPCIVLDNFLYDGCRFNLYIFHTGNQKYRISFAGQPTDKPEFPKRIFDILTQSGFTISGMMAVLEEIPEAVVEKKITDMTGILSRI